MPRIRATGLATVMVLLMSISASPTFAQLEDGGAAGSMPRDQRAVAVTGTSTLVGQADEGTASLDGSVISVRGNVLMTVEESSDPRVSGRATITVNFDAYPDAAGIPAAAQVRYGEARIDNEMGSWSGRFAGSLANGRFVQTYWLAGAGDYEGLSYVVTAGGNGNVWRSQGLIFPGAVPPLGSSIRLPVDGLDIDLPAALAPAY